MNLHQVPLSVCIYPRFFISHNGDAQLGPDDLLGFVMHDQSGNVLGQVFGMNNQAVFSYVPGMILGQTYYISAIAGTNNGNGSIDLSDPCLSVSPGVAVVFYDCDPKEDEHGAEVADHDGRPDPVPFDDGIEENKLVNEEQGNSSNVKTNLLLDDPDVVIKTLRVYDLLGRLLLTEENIPFADYLISPERFHRDLVSGYYLEVIEVEKGDGEMEYVSRRFTVMGR